MFTVNTILKYNFEAWLNVDCNEVESVEKIKMLGLTILTEMKWQRWLMKWQKKNMVSYGFLTLLGHYYYVCDFD